MGSRTLRGRPRPTRRLSPMPGPPHPDSPLPQQHGAPLTAAVFHELVDELFALEGRLSLPDIPLDDTSVLEGYKWIFSILAVGLDAYVWADPARPRFVDIVGPYRKWGGDNADAFYQYAPIDPRRTYVVNGRRG